MLSQRTELESKLVDVHKSSGVLDLLRADADQMASSISATSVLAQSVSSKVTSLACTTSGASSCQKTRALMFLVREEQRTNRPAAANAEEGSLLCTCVRGG